MKHHKTIFLCCVILCFFYRTCLAAALNYENNENNEHNLIPLHTLIGNTAITNLELNPKGDLTVITGYPEGNFTLKVIDIVNESSTTVFTAKKEQYIHLINLHWIDDNNIYLLTYNENSALRPYNQWLIEINRQPSLSQSLSHNLVRINAMGSIIDPLPNEPDQLLFSAYKGKDKKKIYKTNIKSLVINNFKGQERFPYQLDDASRYWTDQHHQIRFASTYNEDEHLVSHWYLDKDNDWQKYFEFNPSSHEFSPVGFLSNGKLAVLSNIESEFTSLVEFDVKTKTFGELIYQHDRYDLTHAEYDKKSASLHSISYLEHGERITEYFDSQNETINQLIKNTFANKQIDIISSNKDNSKQIIKTFSAEHSGAFYYFDVTNKQAVFIGNQHEFIEQYNFGTVQPMTVAGAEGHKIEAILTKPQPSVDNNVLLVMPHGGPIGIRNSQYFNASVQYLATRGYSVLEVNFRGSEGFGKSYKDSGRGQFGKIIEQDISTVVDHLLSQQKFAHVCAIGGSYGGYSSVMLAIKHPQLYECVIARFGVFDLPLIFNDRNTKREEIVLKRWEYVVGKNDGSLTPVSPVYFAEKLQAPILITAGVKDTRASFEHSNRMKLALAMNNADVEHIYYPSAGHGHRKKITAWHELAYIDDFIRRKLGLDLPKGDNALMVVNDEYQLIAEGFDDNQIVGKFPKRAELYRAKIKN